MSGYWATSGVIRTSATAGCCGQLAQPGDLAHGPVGAVDGQRDAEAVRVRGHVLEQRVGLLGGDAGSDDAHVDATRIHGGEQLRQGRGGRQIAPEELGDAFVAGLAHEGRGRLAGERVDPEVDDRHAGSAAGGGPASWPAAFASAFALALRR